MPSDVFPKIPYKFDLPRGGAPTLKKFLSDNIAMLGMTVGENTAKFLEDPETNRQCRVDCLVATVAVSVLCAVEDAVRGFPLVRDAGDTAPCGDTPGS